LRLEHLFLRLAELMARTEPLDHHFALTTIFEVMDVGARADLKSDVLKDLDKQKQILNGYRGNPAISEGVLDKVIGQLDHCFNSLNGLAGKAGQSLTENDWLMSIRSRVGIPGARANSICRPTTHGNTAARKPGRWTCSAGLPPWHPWQNPSISCSRCCGTLVRHKKSWP